MKKELQRNQRRLVTEVGLERAGQGENVETPLLLMEVSLWMTFLEIIVFQILLSTVLELLVFNPLICKSD